MTWQWLLFSYIAGFALTGVALAITSILAVRYHRELPKKPILESIEVLEDRKRQTEKDYDVLRERLAAALHDIEEGQRWHTWLQENEARIEELKREEQLLVDTQSKHANLKEEIAKQEETLRALREKEAGLKLAVADYEEKLKRIDDLRTECSGLEIRRTQQAEELVRLEGQAKRAADETIHTQKLLEAARGDLQKLREEVERARAALSEVTTRHGQLSGECKILESKADHLRKEALSLAQRVETLHPSPPGAGDRVASIWEPVLHGSQFKRASQKSEAELLQSVAAHFRQCGMKFHDRVIRAFHTSLKIANESPLVVLAGISGTGKSALPKLYSEGMGLYFLNVAVQPSWDSPMDMLGFFNHLEGRFRATELTRALAQMDPFGCKDGSWSGKDEKRFFTLHDRMLLVLLDEMNLARVEYYFSEFLSKLEFRRDIDPENPGQRDKAEIKLETGASGAEHQLMRIYPGTNVLFVGTMNEDESTQTLSDKVVDRANVLRFGMPADLKTFDRARRPSGTSEFVSYRAWQEWLSCSPDLEESQRGEVEQFIAECNQALEPVGKPFAYRTANSILSYARRYPRLEEENWLQHALADQVEQKVLPKLRGVDLQDEGGREAIGRVKKIVSRMEDKTLERAIERGSDERHGHQFVWRGIDRAAEEGQ